MDPTTPDDKTKAMRVRLAYEFERTAYERATKGKHTRYRAGEVWGLNTWLRIARVCEENGVDPVTYLSWALDIQTLLGGRPPEPNQLLAAGKVAAFLRSRRRERGLLAITLQSQKQIAAANIAYRQHGRPEPPQEWWTPR